MPALAFYIDAPLQSWGASSKFQNRETNSFPTKSALIGILAAALGIDKWDSDEAEKLQVLTALKMTVVKLLKEKAPITRLSDFHTIGGGYDKNKSLREKMSISSKASGGPFGTVITRRSYLNDARFIALFEGEQSLLKKIQIALLNPTWGLWFGRKHCLPATPLSPTLGKDKQAALDALLVILPEYQPQDLEAFEYQKESDAGVFYQSDQPVAFGQHHGAVPQPYTARGIVHHRPDAS